MKFITNIYNKYIRKTYICYTTDPIPFKFFLEHLNTKESIPTQVARDYYFNRYGWKHRWPRTFVVYQRESSMPEAVFKVSIKEGDEVAFVSEEIPMKEYLKHVRESR